MNLNRVALCVPVALLFALTSKAQGPEIKFIADTLVVQAEGTFEADPDLATLAFDISSQDKELKPTYDKASQSMQKIVRLAERNGLKKEDVSSGVLTVTPYYDGDKKKDEIVSGARPHRAQGTRFFETRGSHGRIRYG